MENVMKKYLYMHACNNDLKCSKCNWTGCWCQSKSDSKKINENTTKLYQRCPMCNKIITTATQTSTISEIKWI